MFIGISPLLFLPRLSDISCSIHGPIAEISPVEDIVSLSRPAKDNTPITDPRKTGEFSLVKVLSKIIRRIDLALFNNFSISTPSNAAGTKPKYESIE